MGHMDPEVTARLVEVVEAQAGVISREQLRGLGFSDDQVKLRLTDGRLHRLHRGVFAYGHRLIGSRGHWWAAVLAGGAGAALSHRSSGALWDLLSTFRPVVEITTPHRVRRAW